LSNNTGSISEEAQTVFQQIEKERQRQGRFIKLQRSEWFWDILYAASYIVLAGALYSYYMMLSRSYDVNPKANAPVGA